LDEERCNYLLIEYKGDEYQRFSPLIKHLFTALSIENYSLFEGKKPQTIQVFIAVNSLSIEEADKQLNEISMALEKKISKKWKCLPSLLLPNAYNIATLPYKKI